VCVSTGYKNAGRGGGVIRPMLVAAADLQRSPGHFPQNK